MSVASHPSGIRRPVAVVGPCRGAGDGRLGRSALPCGHSTAGGRLRRICGTLSGVPGRELVLGAGAFFLALTAVVATQAMMVGEVAVLRAIQLATSDELDALAAVYTHVSSVETMVVIGAACAATLFAAGWRWRAAAPFGFLLTLPIEMAAKMLVAQPQVDPEYVRRAGNYILLWMGTAYSYPSSHASRAAFLACLVWVALVSFGPLRGRHWLAGAIAAALAVTLGLTRVYLGYHWPSDVVAGWALGLLSFGAVAWAMSRWQRFSVSLSHILARRGGT